MICSNYLCPGYGLSFDAATGKYNAKQCGLCETKVLANEIPIPLLVIMIIIAITLFIVSIIEAVK